MRISQNEQLLLGYDPNPSPNPSRSSDIDFSDVFGGPPRRPSLQELQNRYPDEDDDDDDTWRGDGDWNDETLPGRSSWSNHTGEKPVFGSEIVSWRRYQSQDFFDDIFRGDQSQSSSPRMGGRDPLSSAPGSRALSPARPLPSGAVPLGSPAQFSLPARLANSYSLSNLSRLSGQGHDAFQGGEAFSPNLRGSLSHKASKGANLDGTGGGTQATNGGKQFHFSMHKWASKGVPLVMSLGKRNSLRSKIMLERSLSLNGSVEDESDKLVGEIQPAGVNTDNVLSFRVHVASAAKESKESDQIVNKSVTNVPQLRPSSEVDDGDSPVGVASYSAEESKYDLKQSSMKLHGVEGRSGHDSAISGFRASKSVVENKSAASSDVDRKEYNEAVGMSKLKEQSGLKGDNKRNNIEKNLVNDTAKEKVNKSIGNDREKFNGETGKNGAKGKVKEFVKIFNWKPSSKPSADIERTPSGRWKNTDVSRANSKSTFSSPKTEGKIQGFNMNYSLDSSPKVDENRTLSSGKQFEANSVQEPSHISSTETDNLGSTMGSVSDGFKVSCANIDVAFDSIQIEVLPQIQDKTSENSEDTEDMQPYQSKILKWSKGKEGNIRALLSTLQWVLWPNSGWKPVPLVDIIEANAVKRSYQRALLYLHPDKLQQKGAASHQKFIAQKVFDILQEAWDHFNTLGSL